MLLHLIAVILCKTRVYIEAVYLGINPYSICFNLKVASYRGEGGQETGVTKGTKNAHFGEISFINGPCNCP